MLTLKEIRASDNLTELFDELMDGNTELSRIGRVVIDGYKTDFNSCATWRETNDKAMKIATQVMEEKNFPWPKASNVKLPLICEASIDFAARMLPEILPHGRIVQTWDQGFDPEGSLRKRGEIISECMSYQCLSSPEWQEELDKSLQMLSVVGTVFKKTYWCTEENRFISELASPDKITVNYDTKSLDTARRITHSIKLSMNDVVSKQRQGLYNNNIDVMSLRPGAVTSSNETSSPVVDHKDEDFEIELLEQHCWLDLDDDGYKEPYIVTVHESTGSVLRIVDRIDKVKRNKDKEVIHISAEQYFIDYHFIRSPDGGFYSMGFGQLLLPLNSAANSVMNQLINAGTLSTTQGGFIGKGLRIKGGEYRFNPFEWKIVDSAAGQDLAKNVFPFPVREPSQVLFNLLGMILQMGKELTSSTQAINGDMSGNNVSDKTMSTMIEQGSKIFVAIYKRFLRSLTKEYQRIYCLNSYYMQDKDLQDILRIDGIKVKDLFDEDYNNVRPVADPMFSSMAQRLSKVNVLLSLRTANPRAVDTYVMKVMQYDEKTISDILQPLPPPEPPAKDKKDMATATESMANAEKIKVETQLLMHEAQISTAKAAKDIEFVSAQIGESAARAGKMRADIAHTDQKLYIAGTKMVQQEGLKQKTAQHQQVKAVTDYALRNKELDLKGAEIMSKTALEAQKLKLEAKNTDRADQEMQFGTAERLAKIELEHKKLDKEDKTDV